MAAVDFKKMAGQLTTPLVIVTKHQKQIDAALTKIDGKLGKIDGLLKKVMTNATVKKHPKAVEALKKVDDGVNKLQAAVKVAQQVETTLGQIASQGNIVAKGMLGGGDHKKLKEGLTKAVAMSRKIHGPLDKVEKDLALIVKVLTVAAAALTAAAVVTEGATLPLAAELGTTAKELQTVDKVLKGVSIGLTAFEKAGDIVIKSI